MTGTRRHPIVRRSLLNPTAEDVVRLYGLLKDGPRCSHSIFRSSGPPCAECLAWWKDHDRLHDRLGLGPHVWPVFIPPTDHASPSSHAQSGLSSELEAALSELLRRDAGVNGVSLPSISSSNDSCVIITAETATTMSSSVRTAWAT